MLLSCLVNWALSQKICAQYEKNLCYPNFLNEIKLLFLPIVRRIIFCLTRTDIASEKSLPDKQKTIKIRFFAFYLTISMLGFSVLCHETLPYAKLGDRKRACYFFFVTNQPWIKRKHLQVRGFTTVSDYLKTSEAPSDLDAILFCVPLCDKKRKFQTRKWIKKTSQKEV